MVIPLACPEAELRKIWKFFCDHETLTENVSDCACVSYGVFIAMDIYSVLGRDNSPNNLNYLIEFTVFVQYYGWEHTNR